MVTLNLAKNSHVWGVKRLIVVLEVNPASSSLDSLFPLLQS